MSLENNRRLCKFIYSHCPTLWQVVWQAKLDNKVSNWDKDGAKIESEIKRERETEVRVRKKWERR